MSSADTSKLIAELDRLAAEFAGEIGGLATEEEIRLAQARYLGKKGKVSELMKELGRIPAGERPAVGEAANRAKSKIEQTVAERLAGLDEKSLSEDLARVVDVTLPARGRPLGTLHPLTLVRREIGISYSRLVAALDKSNIALDRKILADLAISDPAAFKKVVETARAA